MVPVLSGAEGCWLIAYRDPANPMAQRIQQHVERLMRSRADIFDEANRKRGFAQPGTAEYADAKRQKVEPGPAQLQIQPLAPGPQSLAALFTITNNAGLQGFDATQVPVALTARINVKTLAMINPQLLEQAVNVKLWTCASSQYIMLTASPGDPNSLGYSLRSGSLCTDSAPLAICWDRTVGG